MYLNDFWAEEAIREIEERDRAWVDPAWWNSDNDHYTSDNDWMEDEWLSEELSAQDYQDLDDWYREEREDLLVGIDLSSNVPWSKVRGFIEDAKGWKSYDTKNGGHNKREPDKKKFAHWHGYKVQSNHVERAIASMVKPCEMVWKIEEKLKSNPKYKHNQTYKKVVDREIRDRLRTKPDWWWMRSRVTRHMDVFDGCVWQISEMDKYGIPRSYF